MKINYVHTHRGSATALFNLSNENYPTINKSVIYAPVPKITTHIRAALFGQELHILIWILTDRVLSLNQKNQYYRIHIRYILPLTVIVAGYHSVCPSSSLYGAAHRLPTDHCKYDKVR